MFVLIGSLVSLSAELGTKLWMNLHKIFGRVVLGIRNDEILVMDWIHLRDLVFNF